MGGEHLPPLGVFPSVPRRDQVGVSLFNLQPRKLCQHAGNQFPAEWLHCNFHAIMDGVGVEMTNGQDRGSSLVLLKLLTPNFNHGSDL